MRLKAITSAVPTEKWDAKRMAELLGADTDFIENKVGVREKYILRSDETGIELAQKAALKLFTRCGVVSEGIDFLIYVTQTPEYRIPQNSALLHDALGLRSDCGAFDISLGCSGWVYALVTAKGLIATGEFNNVMIITCDPYSKIMDPNDKGTAAVFGDGASASLITRNDGLKIGLGDYGTAGHKYRSLIVESGGARDPVKYWHGGNSELTNRDFTIKMQGREVFNFVMSAVPNSIDQCLAKNKLNRDDISVFALHQGSRYMLQSMARRAQIPNEKLAINIEKYGNTVSSSVPMLLEEILEAKDRPEGPILASGFGVGLSWATVVLS